MIFVRTIFACLLAGVLVGTGQSPMVAAVKTSASAGSAPPGHTRAEVQSRYLSQWLPTTRRATNASGGSSASCRPWSTPSASSASTGQAINFARWMTGAAPIKMDSGYRDDTAAAALLMSANRKLSHGPPSNWKCHTSKGSTAAAKSNLLMKSPSTIKMNPMVGDVVESYLNDRGDNNFAAGHRRWLLYPPVSTMGTGNAGVGTVAEPFANALWVKGAYRANNAAPRWSSWPTAGYFPTGLEPAGRWSFSTAVDGADLRRARVHVRGPNGVVPATLRTVTPAAPYFMGLKTLVWDLAKTPAAIKGSADQRYKVTVSGMTVNKKAVAPYSYGVTLFDPAMAATTATAATTLRSGVSAATTRVSVSRTRYGAKPQVKVKVLTANGTPARGAVDIKVDRRKPIRRTLDRRGAATLRLSAGTSAKRHRVVASYRGNANTARAKAGRSFTIGRATPTVSMRITKRVKRRRSFSAVVATRLSGSSVRPTGKVVIFLGKEKVASETLKTRHHGAVKITLPRQKSTGKKKFVVKYYGNSNIGSKRSKTSTVRVY